MRVASVGQAVFSVTLIALGLSGLVHGHFAPIWQPVPKDMPAREGLVYLCGLVALGSGVGLLWPRTAAMSARTLFVYLLLWLLAFKAPGIVRAPAMEVYYESAGETAVIVAGAWVLYARFAGDWDRRHLGFLTGDRGVRIARVLYSLALIAFGLSHIAYLRFTATLVPGWLPAHLAWAYCTGGAYLAAGAAILLRRSARLAAALVALQMGLFTLLVWAPAVVTGRADASQWGEFAVSWTLTASAWVLADSYRGTPWFAAGKR